LASDKAAQAERINALKEAKKAEDAARLAELKAKAAAR